MDIITALVCICQLAAENFLGFPAESPGKVAVYAVYFGYSAVYSSCTAKPYRRKITTGSAQLNFICRSGYFLMICARSAGLGYTLTGLYHSFRVQSAAVTDCLCTGLILNILTPANFPYHWYEIFVQPW